MLGSHRILLKEKCYKQDVLLTVRGMNGCPVVKTVWGPGWPRDRKWFGSQEQSFRVRELSL